MKDIKEKSDKDLAKLLKNDREELRKFRFGIAGAGSKKGRQPKVIKKEIAQILTELKLRK